MKKFWSIWAKTMGNKISPENKESDIAAIIRTIFFLLNVVTCIFIILSNGKNLGYWK
jgi:hypothetical protein